MTGITELATEPQKVPLTPRIHSVPLRIREDAIAFSLAKMTSKFPPQSKS